MRIQPQSPTQNLNFGAVKIKAKEGYSVFHPALSEIFTRQAQEAKVDLNMGKDADGIHLNIMSVQNSEEEKTIIKQLEPLKQFLQIESISIETAQKAINDFLLKK